MKVFGRSFRACTSGLALPVAGAILLCGLCVYLNPQDTGTGADQTSGQWLHVAGLLLVAAVLGAAVEAWPLFSRARPGHEFVLRAQRTPLHGCVAAAAGGLCALVLALTVSAFAFASTLALFDVEQGDVRGRLAVDLRQERPFLDHEQAALVFDVRDHEPAHHLTLRPDAFFSGRDTQSAEIEVHADGAPLHEGFLANAGEPIVLALEPPRRVQRIEVRRKKGRGLLLRLPAARVELASARVHSALLNCLLATWTYLLPAVLALAVMIAGHRHLALPVNLAAGLVTCLLATVLGITPNAAAITSFSRAQWLLGADGLDLASLWSVPAAGLLVLLSGLAHRR